MERNHSSQLGLQSHGQSQNFSSSSPEDLSMEDHVALAVLSHSARWAKSRGQSHYRCLPNFSLPHLELPYSSSFLFRMSGQQPGPSFQADCLTRGLISVRNGKPLDWATSVTFSFFLPRSSCFSTTRSQLLTSQCHKCPTLLAVPKLILNCRRYHPVSSSVWRLWSTWATHMSVSWEPWRRKERILSRWAVGQPGERFQTSGARLVFCLYPKAPQTHNTNICSYESGKSGHFVGETSSLSSCASSSGLLWDIGRGKALGVLELLDSYPATPLLCYSCPGSSK